MAQCNLCNTASRFISSELGVCLKCIRERPEDALALAVQAHTKSSATFGLPKKPPKDPLGIPCNICVNECRIPENEIGYCGLRKNEVGKITGVSSEKGKLSWCYNFFRQIVSETGYVLEEQEQVQAIPNMLTVRGLNWDIRILRYFFMDDHLIAFIVRTGSPNAKSLNLT
jgi:hypothetical protein